MLTTETFERKGNDSERAQICSNKQQHGAEKISQDFQYDRFFTEEDDQVTVFNAVVRPAIDDIMEGYNATILAYGQTSSGKTFTMQGGETNQRELDGIVPRAAAELFQRIHNGDAHVECDVKVSCIEIYMEQVFDLLDSIHPQKSLRLRQDTQRNVFVKGMAKICIRSAQEFMEQVQQAIQNRSVAVTRMNARSSRSHIVVILALEQRHVDSQVCKEGKLSLVDLAGSEIVRRTGAGGQQLEEAKTINKSLSALGMVITNLASPNARHIPYCDSKLTRIVDPSRW
uniref:Kinesin-like protein n=1 Tax=Albugo laibachii Nc14 TaxID=890382 RepID=F0WZB2_9STRA|nr:kinesinlike protein putative [Albugo laibachii Nc14]|eukprot:CCA26830.1 kinesinlike protein putative [Albugo laibachii Nc14]